MSNCHIVGNHMSRLLCCLFCFDRPGCASMSLLLTVWVIFLSLIATSLVAAGGDGGSWGGGAELISRFFHIGVVCLKQDPKIHNPLI